MSLPQGRQDLVGNLVISGSTELNIPVGVNISTGSSSTSNEVSVPNPGTQIVLVQMPSGSVLCQLSIYETNADFVTPTDSKTSLTGLPLFLIGNSTTTLDKLKVKLSNNSGSTLAPTNLALLSLCKVPSPEDLLSGVMGNAASVVQGTHYGPDGSAGTGAFDLTQGN